MLIYLSYRFHTNLTSLFQRESSAHRSGIRMKWSDRFEMIYRLRFKHHFSRRERRATSNCVDGSDSAAFDSIVELSRGRSNRTGSLRH